MTFSLFVRNEVVDRSTDEAVGAGYLVAEHRRRGPIGEHDVTVDIDKQQTVGRAVEQSYRHLGVVRIGGVVDHRILRIDDNRVGGFIASTRDAFFDMSVPLVGVWTSIVTGHPRAV